MVKPAVADVVGPAVTAEHPDRLADEVVGNREELLPDARGRQWYECDVNYFGGHRGAERLLFSNDGMICYSGDHYNSYEVLYENWYYEDGWYLYD